MNIEEQVLSIEQAKHLQELGLDMSDAAFCWLPLYEETLFIPVKYIYKDDEGKEIFTYTLQEMLNRLPKSIIIDGEKYLFDISLTPMTAYYYWVRGEEEEVVFTAKDGNLFMLIYRLLCWVVENGYLKEERKCN